MAEKREKFARILLNFYSNTSTKQPEKIELFHSEDWKDGKPGYSRIRINGKFKDSPDGSNAYFTANGIGRIVARALSGETETSANDRLPIIPAKTSVKIATSVIAGKTFYSPATTLAPPHVGPDGRYMVWVYIPEIGYSEVHHKELVLPAYRPLRGTQKNFFQNAINEQENAR